MKWRKKSLFELAAVFVVAAVVLTLALLQYRWASQIGRAEQDRLNGELSTGVESFTNQFAYDVERLMEAFPNEPDAPEAALESRAAQEYAIWAKASSHPGIVGGIYIWKTAYAPTSYYETLDLIRHRFEKIEWPRQLHDLYGQLAFFISYVGPMPDDREAALYPWVFFEDEGVLARPILQAVPDARDPSLAVRPFGVLVVHLDRDYLSRQYFPDLVDRTFGVSRERALGIAVRSAQAPFDQVYISGVVSEPATQSGAVVNLFDSVQRLDRRRGYAPVETSRDSRQWQLVVQEPAGTLEGLVAAWRNRNLLLSFGLLAILAACVAFIFVLARRAEQLARLEMEFVAGVSHELCTPLAVISSAAENLADGIVESRQQLVEYGKLIHDQSTRLDRLVDQILAFAAGRYRQSKLTLVPTALASVVTQAVVQSEAALRDAGLVVETDVPSDLPLVLADSATVAKCIENLITNAIKYAGANASQDAEAENHHSLTIRVQTTTMPRQEVQIAFQDSGAGISAVELAKIFEPFYRAQNTRNGQARGVGLGLYLVKQMMEHMHGRVSATSEVGHGASFVLHFPIAAPSAGIFVDPGVKDDLWRLDGPAN